MENKIFIAKTDNCVEMLVDSTLTIPVQMGSEVFCTINFIKHKMDLQIDKNGDFNNHAKLTKEIVSSITLTEKHALELSEIIKSQIEELRKLNK
ncbi:hypothetical protein [Kluyvera cryocrescens]|uniref:hypothetical protein n=1 Tax=Kluyvera cryocrescens TaxID=580 RepID=UPI000D84F9B9|nr:hypothetical protein [Kluyvera cryocrescens]SQC34258.1 Uncharacterised protein [Kluyvera cryocrescens]